MTKSGVAYLKSPAMLGVGLLLAGLGISWIWVPAEGESSIASSATIGNAGAQIAGPAVSTAPSTEPFVRLDEESRPSLEEVVIPRQPGMPLSEAQSNLASQPAIEPKAGNVDQVNAMVHGALGPDRVALTAGAAPVSMPAHQASIPGMQVSAATQRRMAVAAPTPGAMVVPDSPGDQYLAQLQSQFATNAEASTLPMPVVLPQYNMIESGLRQR